MIWVKLKNPVVSLNNVTKRFGKIVALRRVSLEIPTSTIFGLIGPNGAGKTTMIKIILGYLRPDEGDVKLF